METIGDQIKTIRRALGMTQAQLAERSGLAQSMIARIEKDEKWNPNFTTINKLAEALNCSFTGQLIPKKDIPIFLEEQSERLARKIVAISSGSFAIESQLPSQQVIEEQILQTKKDLLEKHKWALWQKI